jgi:thiol-disulfide isomerase/thioredoxin
MRKTIQTIVMATLCLIFKAEAQDNKAVDVTTKGIQIGQKVPDIVINNLHNYKDANGRLSTTAKLSDFEGKLLILDFWATWCAPCVAMIPKMDSLQQKFGDKVQFLTVTYQNEKEILPFLTKLYNGKSSNLSTVLADNKLRDLFPHKYLPHYVWIDETGKVKAITGHEDIKADAIQAVLNGVSFKLTFKNDQNSSIDLDKPLLLDGNGNSDYLINQSLLTGYIPGLALKTEAAIDSLGRWRLTMRNLSISGLFLFAFGKDEFYLPRKKLILEVNDKDKLTTSLSGDAYLNWGAKGNLYCYQVIMPETAIQNKLARIQQDLRSYFPDYSVGLVERKKSCYILVRTSSKDKIKTSGSKRSVLFNAFGCKLVNVPLKLFLNNLDNYYLQTDPNLVLDESGYKGNIDLTLQAKLSDLKALNTALEPYDLKFIIAERKVDMLLVRDKPNDQRLVKSIN